MLQSLRQIYHLENLQRAIKRPLDSQIKNIATIRKTLKPLKVERIEEKLQKCYSFSASVFFLSVYKFWTQCKKYLKVKWRIKNKSNTTDPSFAYRQKYFPQWQSQKVKCRKIKIRNGKIQLKNFNILNA